MNVCIAAISLLWKLRWRITVIIEYMRHANGIFMDVAHGHGTPYKGSRLGQVARSSLRHSQPRTADRRFHFPPLLTIGTPIRHAADQHHWVTVHHLCYRSSRPWGNSSGSAEIADHHGGPERIVYPKSMRTELSVAIVVVDLLSITLYWLCGYRNQVW